MNLKAGPLMWLVLRRQLVWNGPAAAGLGWRTFAMTLFSPATVWCRDFVFDGLSHPTSSLDDPETGCVPLAVNRMPSFDWV